MCGKTGKILLQLLLLFCLVFPPGIAWADCPTHGTAPAGVEPNPDPPTTPDDCDEEGGVGSPPPDTPPDTGASPQPEPPVFGSGASCPTVPPPPPPPPPPECPNVQASPDSLPTVGERVRLHVVGGGGAVPVRWGKTISFGDGFRLNYLSYFQLTADGLYARLYDPAGQAVHNFRTDPDAPASLVETVVVDGETFTAHQYGDCYLGKTPDMNRVTIKTYTRSGERRPVRVELVYPEGGSLHYEFDSHEPMTGDLAGPLYRVARRVTKEGHAVTFTYGDDRLVIRDASGNEYICHLDADNHIVRIAITAGDETRTWSYAYTTGKIIETNDQTGLKMEMRGTNYVTATYLTPQTGGQQYSSYTRDSNGNLTYMTVGGDSRSYSVVTLPDGNTRHVEKREGRTITREYGVNGLLWQENSLGEREEFRFDEAKRLTYYKNALGHEWRYEYSSPGRTGVLVRNTAPDGGETLYEYVPGTNLISEKRVKTGDGVWETISYSYDAQGRLLRETRQLGDSRASETRYVRRPDGRVSHMLEKVDDSRWAATYYEHDSVDRVTLIKGPYYVSDPENPADGLPEIGKSYVYDAWGNRTSDTDELGNVTRYEYDSGNHLVATVNPLGQRTEYAYDGLGQRVRQTDALGNRTEWSYDSVGRVTSIQGSAGVAGCNTCALAAGTADKPGTYAWSSSGLLLSFTDLESKTTRYEYDAARRKSKETDPLGNATLFGYDAAGNLASVTDPLGNITQYAHDAAGRRISTTDPLGNISGVEYNLAGQMVRSHDAAGGEHVLTYGTGGRLLAGKVRVDGDTWRETRYGYNIRGDMIETTDAFGTPDAIVTRFENDAAGRVTATTVDPDGLDISRELAYDAAGRLVEQRDGNGNATSFFYDAVGNLLSVVTPEGRETAFAYDDAGHRIEMVLDPDGVAQGRYVAYDAAGRVVDESDGVTARSFVYDKTGLRTRILTPGQGDVFLVYNRAGNILEIRRLNLNGSIAMSVKREYDKAGRVVKTVNEAGKATLYEYDAAGRLAKTTDPLGAVTRFEYDAAGRQTKIILPHGGERRYFYNLAGELARTEGGAEGTVQYRYDGMGRPVETIDANGRSRKTFYDLTGRVVRIENEMGQPIVYTYDAVGNKLTLTDANGNTTQFVYDRDDNLFSMTYPPVIGQSDNIEQYQYDAAGRLVCKMTPNGDHIRTLYDPAGNVLALYHGANVEDVDAIPANRLIAKYERNGVGAVTKEEDSLTAMLYNFDAFGRLVESRDNALDKSVRYEYDPRGLRTKMEVVDYASSQNGSVSMTVVYGYDDAGRLATVKKDADPAAVYEYDLSGRRVKLALPNGVITEYTYDSADHLLDLTTRKDATVLASFAYSHGPSGNRTGITYADGSRSMYEFDNAYRLTRDKRVDALNQTLYDEAYTYDSVGNHLAKTRTIWNPVSVSYAYNARNQIVSTTGTESQSYAYNANGDLVIISSEAGNETMIYDILNRLIRYEGPNGVQEIQYRGASWHRWNTTGTSLDSTAVQTTFLYDNDNVVADYINSELIRLYVTPKLDQNLSMTIVSGADAGTYYYSQDGVGSTQTLSGVTGAVFDRYDYTAFGEPCFSNDQNTIDQRYKFQGREDNGINGILFFRNRNFSYTIGRFLTKDPLSYTTNIDGNVYAFASNNAVINKDPYGLEAMSTYCERRLKPQFDSAVKGQKTALGALWKVLKGNKSCEPKTECAECTGKYCDTLGYYSHKDKKIYLCSNNVDPSTPWESVSITGAHELIHAAQDLCHSWTPTNCEKRICMEIQAYGWEHVGYPGTQQNDKESIRKGVRSSMPDECLAPNFNTLFNRNYDRCLEKVPEPPRELR